MTENELHVAPYGSWKSPITSDLIVAKTMTLEQIILHGEDIYWTERRPAEGGRSVLVRRGADGQIADITPPGFNVRTRVHEYGGGAFAIADGAVYFSNFADNRMYRQDLPPGAPPTAPRPITSETRQRYADVVVDSRRSRMICVCEDHTGAGREPVNTIVDIDLSGERASRVLVSGHDFYSTPRLSPDGSRLAWLAWNHPNMPWDGCELWAGEIEPDGSVGATERVAGGVAESIFQPTWSPDSILHFVSDRTGWWNLYRWRAGQVEPLHQMEAEFGLPQWLFGAATYSFESANRIACAFVRQGVTRLALLDTETGTFETIETPYTAISYPRARPGRIVFTGGSPRQLPAIVELDLTTRQIEVIRRSSAIDPDPGYLSIPQPIEFPSANGRTAYGFFYPPRNRDYSPPAGERPPLLVISHGGPTGATSSVLNLEIQFWTSRGIAILDVNYGGSTGYGREYRERLNGQWGVVDVEDCISGALYLVDQGKADRDRLAIRGGSAGGYTTLCALTFHNVFRAGASYFGIGDLEPFVSDTHKYESRYLERLIGPYPEQRDRYYQRSPIHFTDQLSCPVILFQGLDDKIVPPNQAELMLEALRAKGLPVAYVPFEGEGHGFRNATNIKRAFDSELYFYSRVFGFELADPVEPVPIENLSARPKQ